jgi:hypothetical protein
MAAMANILKFVKVCKGQYIDYQAELIKSKYKFWSTEKHKNHKDKKNVDVKKPRTIDKNDGKSKILQ